MQSARSRFSHRHLLALGTFLVPLAMFAGLVWSELQRSGASAQAAMFSASRQFVKSARRAIEQRLDEVLPPLLEASKLLEDADEKVGTIDATRALAGQPLFGALRAMVILDDRASVLWPLPPWNSSYLPLLSDAPRGEDPDYEVQMADICVKHGELQIAREWLQHLLERLAAASGQESEHRRGVLDEHLAIASFKLGEVLRKLRRDDEAREHFRFTLEHTLPRRDSGLRFITEYQLAEMGADDERLHFLRAIANNQYDTWADDLLTSLALRLAATFPAEHPARKDVDTLLTRELDRVAIREFATVFQHRIRHFVNRRNEAAEGTEGTEGTEDPIVERLIWTERDHVDIICIRHTTAPERKKWNADRVALQLDLRALLGPILQPATPADGKADGRETFVLAVQDWLDLTIVPPPPSTPPDWTAPTDTINGPKGLTLAAYPADPAKLVADAEASANQRTLAIVALFVMALGGALWSWRSVSRETELAEMKVDLVSRVSHELKTPLALVRMYGETLGMGRARDAAQASEFGGIIAREAERLTTLIQRILDFSRQQAGTLNYEAEPIDLTQLLRTVVEAYGPHLQSRGAVLIDSIANGIRVHCDPNACESAVVNLLENAAKYGKEGDDEHEIEIELLLEPRSTNAVIEVRDRGRGIPAAERDRVFDGFYRASNAGEVRGAGLGLSLVRHFAHAHGGEIQALPRDGGGTTMRLTLPLVGATVATTTTKMTPPATAIHPAPDS
jgi:signal transduction histidine kinase/tetratricopeptide (TPR) repeat protein